MVTKPDEEVVKSDEERDDAEPADIDEGFEEDADDGQAEAEGSDDDGSADPEEEGKEAETDDALAELETEELEMLTEDEASETLVIDEQAEMRALRRAELAMSFETPGEARQDEFVCQSCFLVKRSTQLADKRRKWCTDCAG